MIFPKLYQPEKSQPKERRLLSFCRSWPWAYFLDGPNAAGSIASTLIRHCPLPDITVPDIAHSVPDPKGVFTVAELNWTAVVTAMNFP